MVLDGSDDFEQILSRILKELANSSVGLTTTQITQSVYGNAKTYPIILVTGMLGCLSAMDVVEFTKAGKARIWKLKETERARELIERLEGSDVKSV